MSDIIETFPLCSFEGEAGSIDIYLMLQTYQLDYESRLRRYNVRLMANVISDSDSFSMLGLSNFKIFGRSVTEYNKITLTKGENVLHSVTLASVKADDYDSVTPFELLFGHTCAELGISSAFNIKKTLTIHPFYTAPQINVSSSEKRLGQNVELLGSFLDAGYYTTAKIFLDGACISAQVVNSEKKYLSTFLEWIEPYKYSKSIDVSVTFESSFDGNPLPNTLTLPLTLVLDKEDGAPKGEAMLSFVSDNSKIRELGIAVKNRSAALVEIKNIQTMFGAEVDYAVIQLDGDTVIGESFLGETLGFAGVHSFKAQITDTRGFETAINGTFEVLDYAPPRLTATAKRVNDDGYEDGGGENVMILADAETEFPFGGENVCSLYYVIERLHQSDGIEFPLSAGERLIVSDVLDKGEAYNVKVICRDTFGASVSKSFFLDRESVELNIAKNSVAIGKYATREELFDCAWPIRCTDDVTVVDRSGNEKSLMSLFEMPYNVKFYDVESEAEFASLTTPSEGVTELIVMNLLDSFFGHSKGIHVFIVYNRNGSGGDIKLV